MLAISQSGTVADVLASMRGVHSYVVPYAAAMALTRTAKVAYKDALPDAMRADACRSVTWRGSRAIPQIGQYLPGQLVTWSAVLLAPGTGEAAWPALGVSLALMVAALGLAWWRFERQEL